MSASPARFSLTRTFEVFPRRVHLRIIPECHAGDVNSWHLLPSLGEIREDIDYK